MNRQELLDALMSSLNDNRVSRGERTALAQILDEQMLDAGARLALQAQVFDRVREQLHDPRDKALLQGLEDVVKLLRAPEAATSAPSRVLFGPQDPMWETLHSLVCGARTSLDLAVFTLTDDRLSNALIDVHRRGVRVRLLSDDSKSDDKGSDVRRLRKAGVPVCTDGSPFHFHHKFAVIDDRVVVTGSYNWTRSADERNRENVLVTEDRQIVMAYAKGFEQLWAELG
ncbi:MAG: cardiolipin hydrolase [Kiritimatiellia bacterium]|jgi:cardiolipin hydrolase